MLAGVNEEQIGGGVAVLAGGERPVDRAIFMKLGRAPATNRYFIEGIGRGRELAPDRASGDR